METQNNITSTGTTLIKPDQSDYGVQLRRNWVAEQYIKGEPSHYIWLEYQKKYALTKHSFDKDILEVRKHITIDVRENFEEILNNELLFLYDLRDKALKEGDKALALRVQKQVTDLIKLVTPKTSTGMNVQINNNSTNLSLPNLSIEEIRELLGGKASTGIIDITNE